MEGIRYKILLVSRKYTNQQFPGLGAGLNVPWKPANKLIHLRFIAAVGIACELGVIEEFHDMLIRLEAGLSLNFG